MRIFWWMSHLMHDKQSHHSKFRNYYSNNKQNSMIRYIEYILVNINALATPVSPPKSVL